MASALAVNKFCNYAVDDSNAQVSDGNNPTTRVVNKKLEFTDKGSNSDKHYINSRINSYFPTLLNENDVVQFRHHEKYIKLNLNLVLIGTSTLSRGLILKLFEGFNQRFTNDITIPNKNDYFNKNLFGYLKKQYYNNCNRLNITDITFRNDTKLMTNNITVSEFRIGNFRLLGHAANTSTNLGWGNGNSILYNYFVGLGGSTINDNFSTPINAATSDNVSETNKIILPLNIYYDSPDHVDVELNELKTDIFNFIKQFRTAAPGIGQDSLAGSLYEYRTFNITNEGEPPNDIKDNYITVVTTEVGALVTPRNDTLNLPTKNCST